ncbi:MAG: glycosyltransferase family 4 protein [Chloroflexi bacterium]|nr:glycosyltransferase family 4 protein [Chloroflexota bacterium]
MPKKSPRAPIEIVHVVGTAARTGTAHVRIVEALARGLAPDRYRLHCWFLGEDGPLAGELARAGVHVRALRWNGLKDPSGMYRFARALRSQRVDIVHKHVGGRSLPLMVRMMTRAKQVSHAHGTVSETGEPLPVHSPRLSDRVIATSWAVAAAISKPSSVIHPSAPALDLQIEPRPGAPIIGVAGRLAPIKGIHDIIGAMPVLARRCPSVRLEIAGEGPEEPSLAALADRLGVRSAVDFLGWQTDLEPMYRRWSVFVQPSHYEGFGMSALEAMGAGLPVVATNVGGVPEVVVDGVTGLLVPPGDPAGMGAAVLSLLEDADRRARMAEAGRRRVRDDFSEARLVAATAQVYDELG